jgi:hypothetical protein
MPELQKNRVAADACCILQQSLRETLDARASLVMLQSGKRGASPGAASQSCVREEDQA